MRIKSTINRGTAQNNNCIIEYVLNIYILLNIYFNTKIQWLEKVIPQCCFPKLKIFYKYDINSNQFQIFIFK
jgi:hypothetical protein